VVRSTSIILGPVVNSQCAILGSHLPGSLPSLHATDARKQTSPIYPGRVSRGERLVRLLRHEHLHHKPLPFAPVISFHLLQILITRAGAGGDDEFQGLVDYTFTRPDGSQLGTQGTFQPIYARFELTCRVQHIALGCKTVRFFDTLHSWNV
jgi:hypothetical protein